jgi:hypothetical protein
MAFVECSWCGKSFLKPQKRINQTKKLGKKHACTKSCASKLTNEDRKQEPITKNAINTRRDKEKFPEKHHARYLVRQAVKSGKFSPPELCEVCDSDEYVEGHHPDYSRPFFLLYLCKKCHIIADLSYDKWEELATEYRCIIE